MKSRNWKDVSYLKSGSLKQKKVYKLLKTSGTLKILSDYNPLLVGTIPIEIDTENSDIDIVCEVYNFAKFEDILKENFNKYKHFKLRYKKRNIIICNFWIDSFEVEIYGTNNKSEKSDGYRHMIVESRILSLYGNDFKKKVIQLKKEGIKTEPAFARLLNLKGNPYEELLLFENYTDEEIENIKF
ncbi:MAG: DUF4269 domain-containing protein [Clostridium sp.]|nr:DUF4269 domain-containing protein [Clostridium sp.]